MERVHGGYRPKSDGLAPGDVVDFSASLNPYGPPSGVLRAALATGVSTYPDPDYSEVRETLAAKLDVDWRQIVLGNGSSELIFLLARALGGSRALVLTPCFGDYLAALQAAGSEVVEVRARAEAGFVWDIAAIVQTIKDVRPGLVFLGQPNNPTGVYSSRDAVRRLAAALDGGFLVLDEAFVDFVERPWSSLRFAPNVVTLRSFTKAFTIPGLRVGYMVAAGEVADAVRLQQPSWSVSAPAAAAARACILETFFLEESTARLRESRRALASGLCDLGLTVMEGEANFVLVRVTDAARTTRQLLALGIAVRDCSSFGLPEYIRVAVRRPDENDLLVKGMREALGAG